MVDRILSWNASCLCSVDVAAGGAASCQAAARWASMPSMSRIIFSISCSIKCVNCGSAASVVLVLVLAVFAAGGGVAVVKSSRTASKTSCETMHGITEARTVQKIVRVRVNVHAGWRHGVASC